MTQRLPRPRTLPAILGMAAMAAATLMAVFDSATLKTQVYGLQVPAVDVSTLDGFARADSGFSKD